MFDMPSIHQMDTREACLAAGGFSFGATEATGTECPRRIGVALTEHLSPPRLRARAAFAA